MTEQLKFLIWKLRKYIEKFTFFVFSHKESAGLSGIEAAMCGAKLYIPTDTFNRSFIQKKFIK